MYNKNKRWFLMLFYVVSMISISTAQYVVKGNVTELADNEAIIGASIEEKGSTNGTISDIDGSFTINVQNDQAVLIIKYLGYNDEEINVKGQKEINIKMTESSILIDQVVVVGYGVQKKSDLTGAVSSLKGTELARVTSPNIEQALDRKSVV